MLAPVLARLDAIPGLGPARVDSSGRFFWLAAEGVDRGVAGSLAREVLGEEARTLAPVEAEAQLSGRRLGDPWFTASEVMALSFVEGRLLSVRIANAAAREIGAGPAGREAIAEAVRLELFAALARAHAEGGRRSSAWIDAEWPAIAARAASRCTPSLSPEEQARLAARLPGLLRA